MSNDVKKRGKRVEGVKYTPQRRAVYEAMQQMKHASAEELCVYLEKQGFIMPPSTVYRTLETFDRAGVLSVFRHPLSGRLYYDITTGAHHHLLQGEEIQDYDDAELTATIKEHLKSRGIEESKINLIRVEILLGGGELLLV